MKLKIAITASSLALTALSNGAISLSGTAALNPNNGTGTDVINTLVLLVIDTGADGFLNGEISTGSALTSLDDPRLTTGVAGLDIGTTFGGDLVFGRTSTQDLFGSYISGNFAGLDATSVLSSNFALVYFNNLASTATGSAPASAGYGILRAADWVMPDANVGTFQFGNNASNAYATVTIGQNGSAATVTKQGAAIGFATSGGTFAVVPEPSAALLGLVGVLGLVRRRR